MAMGIVSQDQFEDELNILERRNNSTKTNARVDSIPTKGRNEGDVNVPESLRKIIGETSVIDGRQEALTLARGLGISDSSVSAYAKGATSTTSYNSPSKSLIDHINTSRRRAIKRASNTMNRALGAITQEKLDYADVKDLSTIAKDMSVIIKNLEPPAESNQTEVKQQQFVIFAPQFKKEQDFETIQVNE